VPSVVVVVTGIQASVMVTDCVGYVKYVITQVSIPGCKYLQCNMSSRDSVATVVVQCMRYGCSPVCARQSTDCVQVAML
jgi:hypothetical protein